MPRLLGKGRFGLLNATDLPRLLGKGRLGLNATDLPRLFGKGKFGLAATTDLPRLLGKGRFGLAVDTFALAMHGTTRTADKAATDSSFMEKPPRGLLISRRIAYVLRTLAEVAWCTYNFGGI